MTEAGAVPRRITLRGWSLRTRLIVAVTTVSLVALVIADVVTYDQLHSFLFNQVDNSLTSTAGATANGLSPPGFEFGPSNGSPSRPQFGSNPSALNAGGGVDCDIAEGVLMQFAPGTFVQVRHGSTVLTSCTAGLDTAPTPKLPVRIPGYSSEQSSSDSATVYFTTGAEQGSSQFRVLAASVVALRCRPGTGSVVSTCGPTTSGPAVGFTVLVAEPLGPTIGTLGRLFDVELAVTAAALMAALVLGWWLVRIGLRPLRAVEVTAAAIADGELDQRVPGGEAQTEVGRLARALNVMLGRIESAFGERDATERELRESEGRMRQFVADASHELRTPLAAISAYAELFGRGASTRAHDLERVMTGISSEAGRMSHLVEDLLLLARLDEGRPLARQAVELVGLAGEAVQTARTVAPAWPITLTAREPVEVIGDAPRLRQVLDNLLSNVRSHSPEGTATELSISRDGEHAVLSCADDGPGLDATAATRVFERFYRADPSRSRQHGGAGLGLSIVDSIVRSHGGTTEAAANPGGGVIFSVHLPLAPEPEAAGSE